MVARHWIRALAAASLSIWAGTALAQLQPEIEIDFLSFVNRPVPLSPMVSVLIALVLAAAGVMVLRRSARSGRVFGWLLLGLAAAATGPAIYRVPVISEASAFVPPLQLVNSPATLLISSVGTYTAQNASGRPITLTQVTLNNPGLFFITIGTTCVPGLVLQPLALCDVVVDVNS